MRGVLTYLGHFLAAVIGTAIVESAFHVALPHLTGLNAIAHRELIISLVVGFGLGALASYLRPTRSAYWVWVPMSLVQAIRILLFFTRPVSVLGGGHAQGLPAYLGLDLEGGQLRVGFVALFDFLLPTVRTVAYSVGALVFSKLRPNFDSSRVSLDDAGLDAKDPYSQP